ncbi:MAG TPA: CpXC domain-containing protein [Verrucomicrobiae bacterium]|nr:CpXC domain-containing protein [Verrucomicrobiae bacterium]
MSHTTTDIITCRACGWQQDFTLWKCLNVTFYPERKLELLSSELTTFVCQKCGWSMELLYPLLYHDMRKNLMIHLLPSAGDPDSSTFPFSTRMSDYRFRHVRTLNELVEKIFIAEAGFDDRVVECFKYLLCVELLAHGKPIPQDLVFLEVTTAESGEDVMIFEFSLKEQLGYEAPFKSFRKLEAMLAPQLPSIESDSHYGLRSIPHTQNPSSRNSPPNPDRLSGQIVNRKSSNRKWNWRVSRALY